MVKSNVEHQPAWRGRLQAELHEAHRLERAAERRVHGLERAELQVQDILKLAQARRGDVRSELWKMVSLWLDKLHTARRRRHARQHPRCTLPIGIAGECRPRVATASRVDRRPGTATPLP